MRKTLLVGAIMAALAAPAGAGTVDTAKDAVRDAAGQADKFAAFIEPVFSSLFGLAPLGAWFEGVCNGRCEAPTTNGKDR